MSLVVIEPDEAVDLSALSLDELAQRIEGEHQSVIDATNKALTHLSDGLHHAMNTGDLLLEVRSRTDAGSWGSWLTSNTTFSSKTAHRYMRVAWYRLDIEALGKPLTLPEAIDALLGRPKIPEAFDIRIPEWKQATIRRLRAEGETQREIATRLDLSETSVRRVLDPASAVRQREAHQESLKRRRAERRALAEKREREESDRLAKKAGGDRSAAYTLARKLAATLDAIPRDERNEHWNAAYAAATKAAAEIDKALRA